MHYILEHDNRTGIFTVYSEILPHLVGEGLDPNTAVSDIIDKAITFAAAIRATDAFDGIFTDSQMHLIDSIALCFGDKTKVKILLCL